MDEAIRELIVRRLTEAKGLAMTRRIAHTLIACTSIFLASNAGADDCKLIRFTSLDFTDSGSVIVPVSLENQQVPMAIDTGSPITDNVQFYPRVTAVL